MNITREYYPENLEDKNVLFYIEFTQWDGSPQNYDIYQRQIIPEFINEFNPTGEVHPWKLIAGKVVEGGVDFATKDFLKFTVDSLNKNKDSL